MDLAAQIADHSALSTLVRLWAVILTVLLGATILAGVLLIISCTIPAMRPDVEWNTLMIRLLIDGTLLTFSLILFTRNPLITLDFSRTLLINSALHCALAAILLRYVIVPRLLSDKGPIMKTFPRLADTKNRLDKSASLTIITMSLLAYLLVWTGGVLPYVQGWFNELMMLETTSEMILSLTGAKIALVLVIMPTVVLVPLWRSFAGALSGRESGRWFTFGNDDSAPSEEK